MSVKFLPYNEPEVGEDEVRAVSEAILSRWITRGALTAQFEQALAARLGVSEVVALSSCTAGLHLGLLASGIGPGDEVITTPLTFAASVNAIIHAGAQPVLADIDPDTGNLSPALVERVVTPKTRAVMVVHYGGHAADMAAFNDLRDRRGLTIIEDAAHALASRIGDRWVGTDGNLTAFSFYATKNLTTGEGGALVVPDSVDAERIRVLGLHGMSRNAWNRYQNGGHWRYDVEMPGFKYNMTDVDAAMGLVQLDKLDAMQERRARLAARYRERLQGLPLVLPVERTGYGHAWHLYSVRLDVQATGDIRDQVIEDLTIAGIGTSVHFIPISHHSYYRRQFGWKPGDFPVADAFFAAQISLPLYPSMTLEDVDRVADTLGQSLRRRG